MNKLTFIPCVVSVLFASVVVCADEKPFVTEDGFVSLFDGKSLAGWTGSLNGYAVEDGSLICVKGGEGNLLTEAEYSDFILRFEFKLTEGANNGLGIRCPKVAEGNLHLEGIELQILDDTAEKYKTIKPYQFHGSVYGIVPAKPGSLKPTGQWNQQEVTAKGRHVKIVVNETTVVDANLDEATKSGTLDGALHPGLARTKGHLGFLGHGDRVDFRRIRIKSLAEMTHTSDSLDSIKQRLARKEVLLLDVREQAEWNEVHVEGAILLPNSSIQKGLTLEELLKIVPKDKVIYAHCRSGRRCLSAAEEMSKHGYDVRPLKAGIQELLDAGFPKAK